MKLYALFNILFATSCLIGIFIEDRATLGNSVYLILLFLICSSPLLFRNPFYGRYLLFTLFLGYFFLAFGMFQYADLFFPFIRTAIVERDGFFTPAEPIILLGLCCFVIGYILTANLQKNTTSNAINRNWRKSYLIVIGVISWAVGAFVTIDWSFSVSSGTNNIADLGLFAGVYNNLSHLMMLGELMIVYTYVMWRNKTIGVLLLLVIVVNIFIGFIVDSKEVGFRALAIFMAGSLILRGKVSFKLLIAGFVLVSIGFSVFSQYRDFLSTRGINKEKSFTSLSQNIGKIYSGSNNILENTNYGLNYLLQRLSLNGSTEMVVARTGKDVQYQYGSTIVPVVYAFIPRFIYPNKPDSNIGRLINSEFDVSWSESTYISAGQLAEFYWNFSIPGVVVGMMLIGVLFSFLSGRFDLSKFPTVTRLLLLLVTTYILILRFEGGFAQYYIVWMRLMLLVLLLHVIMPKERHNINKTS